MKVSQSDLEAGPESGSTLEDIREMRNLKRHLAGSDENWMDGLGLTTKIVKV